MRVLENYIYAVYMQLHICSKNNMCEIMKQHEHLIRAPHVVYLAYVVFGAYMQFASCCF